MGTPERCLLSNRPSTSASIDLVPVGLRLDGADLDIVNMLGK